MKFDWEDRSGDSDEYSAILRIVTNQGLDIDIHFHGAEAEYFYIADGAYEINTTEDLCRQVFVGIGEKMYTLSEVIAEASNQVYDDLKRREKR